MRRSRSSDCPRNREIPGHPPPPRRKPISLPLDSVNSSFPKFRTRWGILQVSRGFAQTFRNLLSPCREPHSETRRPLAESIPKFAGAPHNYHLFVEMTPFRKPKPTASREPKRSGTPEHPEDPSRRRVRARSGTPSPHLADGGTSPGVTAAAPKIEEYEKMPESPAPASHESAVNIFRFFFCSQKEIVHFSYASKQEERGGGNLIY